MESLLVGGKCGICGEPYDRQNKLFEKGGALYTGKIVKTYRQGEEIDVKVVVRKQDNEKFQEEKRFILFSLVDCKSSRLL